MNRRQALSLLAALATAPRLDAQTRSTAQHRFALAITHGLLLEPGGTLKTWVCDPGARAELEAPDALGLGHRRTIDSYALYPVVGVSNVVATAVAPSRSFAVLADGRVLAWGENVRGVLGTTSLSEFESMAQPRANTNVPAPVAIPLNAADISSRSDHVVARARDGSVYTWGYGTSGQLGIGPLPVVNFKTRSPSSMPEVPYPMRVPGLADVAAIGTGNRHSLALLRDGTVRAWGENTLGQLGDGTTVNRDVPIVVPGVRNAIAIAAGGYFSVAVLADGSVMQWGSAIHVDQSARPMPTPLVGAREVRSVVAGVSHAAALTQTGNVMTWGNTAHYEVGRGRNAGPAPALIKGLNAVRSLAAAGETTIAVLESGAVMTWGGVRAWTRPDEGQSNLSPSPILLWLDGLDQSRE